MWTVSRNMNCAFNPRENTRRGSSHAHMKCIRQHSRTPPSTTHVWLSRQGEETLSSALTSQLLPREKRIVSQNQRRQVFDNVAQRSRDWISFISYGSCCVLASSLSRWLASNPFGCSNNNRHTNLTLSRYRTYEWNKLILSLELTEHTWISRDVGGDQISCTLPHIVGKIWSEVQNFQMKDCRLSFQQIEHVFLSLCLGSISVKMCMLEIIL